MRIKRMITKGELRPVLKQFLPTSTVVLYEMLLDK